MSAVMAKKPKAAESGDESPKDDRSNRKSAPIQVEKELARMAAVIASYRGITQSELCSPAIRPFLMAEYRLIQEEMAKGLKDDRGGR
jgi:hypothetical protein